MTAVMAAVLHFAVAAKSTMGGGFSLQIGGGSSFPPDASSHSELKFATLKIRCGANFRFCPGGYNLLIPVWFMDLKFAQRMPIDVANFKSTILKRFEIGLKHRENPKRPQHIDVSSASTYCGDPTTSRNASEDE
jgi:hypothetical protein